MKPNTYQVTLTLQRNADDRVETHIVTIEAWGEADALNSLYESLEGKSCYNYSVTNVKHIPVQL